MSASQRKSVAAWAWGVLLWSTAVQFVNVSYVTVLPELGGDC
ncbi:MAG: hypothetical protein ACJA2W_000600 [Planctomycetota bacterium]|jgi:hypothetical protein